MMTRASPVMAPLTKSTGSCDDANCGLGAAYPEDAEDLSQVQKPVLEHAKGMTNGILWVASVPKWT